MPCMEEPHSYGNPSLSHKEINCSTSSPSPNKQANFSFFPSLFSFQEQGIFNAETKAELETCGENID